MTRLSLHCLQHKHVAALGSDPVTRLIYGVFQDKTDSLSPAVQQLAHAVIANDYY